VQAMSRKSMLQVRSHLSGRPSQSHQRLPVGGDLQIATTRTCTHTARQLTTSPHTARQAPASQRTSCCIAVAGVVRGQYHAVTHGRAATGSTASSSSHAQRRLVVPTGIQQASHTALQSERGIIACRGTLRPKASESWKVAALAHTTYHHTRSPPLWGFTCRRVPDVCTTTPT
jgi:hypothetical protein